MPQSRHKKGSRIGIKPYIQKVPEPKTIKEHLRTVKDANGLVIGYETVDIPNPNYGKMRIIRHDLRE